MLKSIATLCLFAAAASAAVKSDLLVSTAWLSDHLKDASVRVIYVAAARTGYDAGHIPGSLFLPLSDIAITKNGVTNEMPEIGRAHV